MQILSAWPKENYITKRKLGIHSVKGPVAKPLNEMGNNVLQQWKLRSVRAATQA
ncbi:MAG: hypothetical protein K0Q46_1425 [Rhodococcus erythropolis]|jgi:hypothetical protein|nr:hypothetical protein [Rhodococcus erythropolis]MCW2428446.1 hypothetical protein [Rhodococcus erythropolis]MDF2894639.1 hypothetical protein [Rhodococcus erythropolis]